MKQLAVFCLTSGLMIMVFAWGVAVSAMSEHGIEIPFQAQTPNPCLYCHVDVHANWEPDRVKPLIIEAPLKVNNVNLDDDLAPVVPTQVCLTCHTMINPAELPGEQIETKINVTRSRILALKHDLGRIYHQYPYWDMDAYRAEKSEEQIGAERIGTLIAVIEADGSWGFHDPDYTEEILAEAEGLMADLLIRTGL